jgi:hypothetical protein
VSRLRIALVAAAIFCGTLFVRIALALRAQMLFGPFIEPE